MFHKILIANRGEIALRVIRACKELGIASVAVYSEADSAALYVRSADEAVHIGPPPPAESYLSGERIIAAAKGTRAEAIHPGYGFLAENAGFAEAVEADGLTFIGPPASAIRAMGDKAEAKARMKAAGVPTVPGAEGLALLADFERAALEIGYPVLIKASAGGGGKGMRVVEARADLAEAIAGAEREAMSAFGDKRLLIEKYIPDAHHVEFQVFGDLHGNLMHLFERECSVQRRYQKIIEESPSPLLTPALRDQMGQAAIAASRAVSYSNAGTIEFIVDPGTREYYFLEMNTRLQVEHPVTEAVTGLDLVHWQIRVAAGERFPYRQEELGQRGHAIECRVYAEDPANGFLPSTGVLLRVVEPQGPGIRVDTGVETGGEVTHHYDPLLAKLIVSAEDRPAAIRRMQAALQGYVIHGVTTNIDFLQAVLADEEFQNGDVSTRWAEAKFDWSQPAEPSREALLATALADLALPTASKSTPNGETDPFSPWKNPSGFRV